MRQLTAALLIMALWATPATASPPDACALYRIEHIRLHTVWALFRQNLGDHGAIIPPMYYALSAMMDDKPAETQRLLEEAASWPETEETARAVNAARLLLDLMRSCGPEGRFKLPPRPDIGGVGHARSDPRVRPAC